MRRRAFLTCINLGDSPAGPEFSVVVVVDDSGSMAGDPIQSVREALRDFVQRAPEGTKIGLVGFGSEVHLYSGPTEYREFLLDQVERFLGQSGSTNLYDAVGSACGLFDEDERHRYVLALTDGGDTGSPGFNLQNPSTGKKSLIDYAAEKEVHVLTVGFGGDSDQSNLQLLADRTGGQFFSADRSSDLMRVFQDALAAMLADRERIRLRPEFGRLLRSTLATTKNERTPWLNLLSLDEWQEDRLWGDATHLRFPSPGEPTVGGFWALYDAVLATEVKRLWTAQVLASNKDGQTFDMGVDLIIVGWLHDPAFRSLSVRLGALFNEIQQEFSAEVRGSITFTFMPLMFQVGRLDEEERKECYAWLTACRNCLAGAGEGWDRRPLGVLPIGQGNQHPRLNRNGLSGLDTQKLLCGAANVLRCVMLAPSLLDEAANHPERPLHAFGAASLSAGLEKAIREALLVTLQRSVDTFRTSSTNAAEISNWVDDLVKQERLGLMEVKDSLLAPLGSGDGAGVLAAVRINLAEFWPPPSYMSEDDYLETLPWAVEERGSEYLYRKTEALRRTLSARIAQRVSSAARSLETRVDGLLFTYPNGGIQPTLGFLENTRRSLLDLRGRMQQEQAGAVAAELEKLRLFSDDERAVFTLGKIGSQAAWQKLEAAIKNRPKRAALFLKHAMMAILLGGLAERLCRFLPPAALNLGPLHMLPLLGGAIVAALVMGVGLVRWSHARQRIATALKEYCGALVREARRRAIDLCLEQLMSFYQQVADWIGGDRSLPKPGEEGRHESKLTEIQRVAALDEYAGGFVSEVSKRHSENSVTFNPFVLELGTKTQNPIPPPAELDLTSPLLAGGSSVDWPTIAPKSKNKDWRQVCRRKRFENLNDYLQYHRERLEFPRRIWAMLEEQLSSNMVRQRRIGELLPTIPSFEQLGQLVGALSFPCVFLRETTKLADPQARWMINLDESSLLSQSHLDLSPVLLNLDASWEAHAFKDLGTDLEDLEEWTLLRTSWMKATPDERKAILSKWAYADSWLEPAEGRPCFAPPVPEGSRDSGGL